MSPSSGLENHVSLTVSVDKVVVAVYHRLRKKRRLLRALTIDAFKFEVQTTP